MLILDNHVVTIRCPRHGFDLHLYLGRARAPDIPFHVDEKRFNRLLCVTRDPQQLIDIMSREVPEGIDFD